MVVRRYVLVSWTASPRTAVVRHPATATNLTVQVATSVSDAVMNAAVSAGDHCLVVFPDEAESPLEATLFATRAAP